MHKVLFDTNVWVDVVLARPAFMEESLGALVACAQEGVEILIAATSLKDVFYFAEKSAGSDAAYASVERIMQVAELAGVDSLVCTKALGLEKPDYEDGIVAACTLVEGADAIVSRDKTSFNGLGIPKYLPGELIDAFGYESVDF